MNIGEIGSVFHMHNLSQSIQTPHTSKPQQQPSQINFDPPVQSTTSQSKNTSLDSLGKGSLL